MNNLLAAASVVVLTAASVFVHGAIPLGEAVTWQKNRGPSRSLQATSTVSLPNARQCLRLCWYSANCALLSYNTGTKTCRLFDRASHAGATRQVADIQGEFSVDLLQDGMEQVPRVGCLRRPCSGDRICVPAWRRSSPTYTCSHLVEDLTALAAIPADTKDAVVTTTDTTTTTTTTASPTTTTTSTTTSTTTPTTTTTTTTTSSTTTTTASTTTTGNSCTNLTMFLEHARVALINDDSASGEFLCDPNYMFSPDTVTTGIFHCNTSSQGSSSGVWVSNAVCVQYRYLQVSTPLSVGVNRTVQFTGNWGICLRARVPEHGTKFSVEIFGSTSATTDPLTVSDVSILRVDVNVVKEDEVFTADDVRMTAMEMNASSHDFLFQRGKDFNMVFRVGGLHTIRMQVEALGVVVADYAVFTSNDDVASMRRVDVGGQLFIHVLEIGCQ